jgi:hypothetical protein
VEGLGTLTPQQQDAFTATSADQEYQVTFMAGSPYNVTVKDSEGLDLATTIFAPTSVRTPPAPTEINHAVVCHVENDGHFYLHLKSREDALNALWEELQTIGEDAQPLASFEKGQVCVAKSSDDQAWYRATITSATDSTATVLFVDYGNSEEVAKGDVRVLPPSNMRQPAFAYDCQLQGVKKWKGDQKDKFVAMTDGKTMNARSVVFTCSWFLSLVMFVLFAEIHQLFNSLGFFLSLFCRCFVLLC